MELGAGVSGFAHGQPVMATLMWGGFAEEVVVPAAMAMPISPAIGL